MFKKAKNVALMGAALAAISFGGSALASAGAAPKSPAKQPAAKAAIVNAGQPDAANDTETNDGIQQTGAGDGETADGPEGGANDAETADGPEGGANDAETADGPEGGADAETADGPGGHADEPGSPNAEHEASGQE
jgi:hypothetical protein